MCMLKTQPASLHSLKVHFTIHFLDLFTAVTKSVIFGFTIGIIGCYKGFNASQGTRGVGRAANQAVVLAMFLIFIEEILVVQVSNWIRYF